ncbi:general secretion pathway protein M [Sphingopyxis sp. OAS728]|jgi:general secretion pathway protein M|uniref:type II secretion system protein GspM n=1 Tax=Sphingopyxis sp. OAS728 TaxID=2663823 RepID=UPI00178B9B4F|nr:type II secretion system protein GspM [Sphingopyxis sp. OAS728]MBE1529148.1 general secretion pathway protein M [Sphingopyxis sp. OAS728]
MTERLQNWWIALSTRERWLVGVAGVLALGVILWGLGRPAVAAFIDLESQHRAAIEREGRVSSKVQLLAQRPSKSVAAAVDAVALDQYLAQSAGEIGLTLDRNEARGAGQATIAIATARATVLTDWLASLEGQGFVIDQLTITPAADGTVGLTAELRKGGQ